MLTVQAIDQRIERSGRHPLRSRFPLRGRERALLQLRGRSAIREHAADLFARRVAGAPIDREPADG